MLGDKPLINDAPDGNASTSGAGGIFVSLGPS